MFSRKQKQTFIKFFSLFSVVRGYNILILVIAQYLAAVFIFGHHLPVSQVVFEGRLFLLVLASALSVAGGYIINNFYDSEKDFINRPHKTMLDRLVSQNTKLSFYFVLNFLVVIIASYISFKAVLFFSMYIFGMWLYSHKLKKMPFIGNLTSAILTIAPFFIIFVYYKNFETVVFVHAIFLFLIIAMRELVKDLKSITGDLIHNYNTIPIVYGESISKIILSVLGALTFIPIWLLIFKFQVGKMDYFFYGIIVAMLVFQILLWKSKTKQHYVMLYNLLKIILLAGVFSIPLIDISVVLNKIPLMR